MWLFKIISRYVSREKYRDSMIHRRVVPPLVCILQACCLSPGDVRRPAVCREAVAVVRSSMARPPRRLHAGPSARRRRRHDGRHDGRQVSRDARRRRRDAGRRRGQPTEGQPGSVAGRRRILASIAEFLNLPERNFLRHSYVLEDMSRAQRKYLLITIIITIYYQFLSRTTKYETIPTTLILTSLIVCPHRHTPTVKSVWLQDGLHNRRSDLLIGVWVERWTSCVSGEPSEVRPGGRPRVATLPQRGEPPAHAQTALRQQPDPHERRRLSHHRQSDASPVHLHREGPSLTTDIYIVWSVSFTKPY